MSSNAQPPVRTGLLDFLKNSSGSQFVIPVYQRNYTWTAGKEVRQYLEDLASVLKGEYANHFLGIIIYLDTPIDFSSREFSVIDGQQRLTTSFLVLYAIRSIIKDQGAKDAITSLDGQFLTNPFATNDNIKYKLKPLVSDDDVYQFIITERLDQVKDKDSKVYKNYLYILNYMKELSKCYSYNEILLALNKLYIVCIPLSEDDNAQKIFESINSTGVKLTAADLIRNFLLMDLSSDLQERYYNDYWMDLENYLGGDARELEAFFRFYLSIKMHALPNLNQVYKKFVEWYKSSEAMLTREEIFKDIITFAKYYYEIYQTDINEVDHRFRGAIKEFRKILSDMPAPLLMGLMDLYHNNKITADQLSQMVQVLNCYLIRRALSNLNTSNITRMFPPLLREIIDECDHDYRNIVDILKKNLVFKNINNNMFVPNDQQLRDYVINANMYKNHNVLRIFLDKLEHDNNPAPVELSGLSVEHLMPQTPTEEWYEQLGVDEETYQHNVNRLGNLTLAAKPDNSRMQNKVWTYKNNVLANTSHLTINQKILAKNHWDISAIAERIEELIVEINRLFPYPKASSKIIQTEEIFIHSSGIEARAMFYLDNGMVEIFEGSELYQHELADNYPDIEDERQALMKEGIVVRDGDRLIFKEPLRKYSNVKGETALSSSASLILHGSRNGWNYWQNSQGVLVKDDKEITRLYGNYEKVDDFVEKSRTSMTKIESERLNFWTEFNRFMTQKGKPFNIRKPSIKNCYDISIGHKWVHIVIALVNKYNYIIVELYIGDNKSLFDELYRRKEEIENKLGLALDWQRMNDKKASVIKSYIPGLDFDNQANYPELMEAILQRSLLMRDVFKFYLELSD